MPSAYGTVDVVRGHPDLVGREHNYAHYGGDKHLILADVQIQGTCDGSCNAVSCYTVIALTPVNSQLSHTVLLRIILSN